MLIAVVLIRSVSLARRHRRGHAYSKLTIYRPSNSRENKLTAAHYIGSQMVRSFIVSDEYRQRFGLK